LVKTMQDKLQLKKRKNLCAFITKSEI